MKASRFIPCIAVAIMFVLVHTTVYASGGFLEKYQGRPDANKNILSANNSQMSARNLEQVKLAPRCKSNSIKIDYYYPENIGNSTVDNIVKKHLEQKFKKAVAETKGNFFCTQEICGGASCGEWYDSETFAAYEPSPGYISILFTNISFTGGSHPNTAYNVLNFTPDGLPLNINDLVAATRKDEFIKKYWNYVYEKWCHVHNYKFPLHYNMIESCEQDANTLNPNTYNGGSDLEDLGRLVFTPAGATLLLGPYESGSYATGTAILDIPKEDLYDLGASKSIWGD